MCLFVCLFWFLRLLVCRLVMGCLFFFSASFVLCLSFFRLFLCFPSSSPSFVVCLFARAFAGYFVCLCVWFCVLGVCLFGV